MRFKIGQKVVCIRGYTSIEGHVLKEGEVYVIEGVHTCKCTECVHVGFSAETGTECTACGELLNSGDKKWWNRADRFTEIDTLIESESIGEELANVIKTANIMA